MSKSECVILIHGLARNKSSMRKIARNLKRNNFKVINWAYKSRSDSIQTIARDLLELIDKNRESYSRIHFVTHSLGAIILRCALNRKRIEKLGKIVMIAPPNKGSAAASLLINNSLFKNFYGPSGQELKSPDYINNICKVPDTNFMIIAGTKHFDIKNPTSWLTNRKLEKPNDGTITVDETKLRSMDKLITVYDSHTFIMKNKTTNKEILNYLSDKSQS